jgi:hypothetical protein
VVLLGTTWFGSYQWENRSAGMSAVDSLFTGTSAAVPSPTSAAEKAGAAGLGLPHP